MYKMHTDALVQAGLKALIAREAGKRLAVLGGTQPKLAQITGWGDEVSTGGRSSPFVCAALALPLRLI